jgi:diacylglycerol kinase family enzyme/membrane-associated phospholipid phosphatase
MPEAIENADIALFRHEAQRHAPLLDKILPRLTRSANKSLLWTAIAIVLNLFGGRTGRRGALRGMLSLALTSFVTNVPAKLLSKRQRPLLDEVPRIRHLARLPTSTSFPSGHSASAFAFATGVALEKPVIGVPLLGLAGAVAYSRGYVGVPYPSDVVAGALIGSSVAIASRNLWPVAPDAPARARAAQVGLGERPDPDGTGLSIVVNPDAGGITGVTTDDIREALPGAEIITIGDDLTLDEALEKATASGRALGVCGGDGTVNAASQAAMRSGKPLVVIPGGTLNHFARALGIDSLDDVKAALETGEAVNVDVGVIAGKPFLNTASFGAYADLVDARERLERRIGKWPAVGVALAKVIRTGEPVRVNVDGRDCDVWLAFIGNCRYKPEGFTPAWREHLDDGILDVRLVDSAHPFARLRLVWAVLSGTLGRSKVYECDVVRGPVRFVSLDGEMRVAHDGETFSASDEFTIEKSRDPLTVIVPAYDDPS